MWARIWKALRRWGALTVEANAQSYDTFGFYPDDYLNRG